MATISFTGEASPTFGYVYVATNPAMPGIVKLGCTGKKEVTKRIDELFTTGVPVPFALEFACRVTNFKEVEAALHAAFGPDRVNPSREFFKISVHQAVAILKLLHVEDVTEEVNAEHSSVPAQDQAAGKALAAKRPPMNFHEMGIPVGAVLTHSDGATSVTVAGPKKVFLGDQEMSLTAATQQIKSLPYSVQPSPFWYYDGKLLKTIYDETYAFAD